MDEFDLFKLVLMPDNQQHLKAISIHVTAMYTLYNSQINDNILKKNHHDLIKKRTAKLINYSAKYNMDIKHGSNNVSTISNNAKKIHCVQQFLTNLFKSLKISLHSVIMFQMP